MRPRYSLRGFTYVEVIVSVFIIGISIILTGAMLQASSLTRHLRYEDLASKIAANKMETLRGAGYAALPASASFSDPLLSTLPQGTASTTVVATNASTKSVTVGVSWRDPGASSLSLVTITTLITSIGGL